MKIIADTATLIPPAEGETRGMTIIPVCVSINDKTYQDYSQITSEEFLKQISEGGVPSSSQPAIGDILDVLEKQNKTNLAGGKKNRVMYWSFSGSNSANDGTWDEVPDFTEDMAKELQDCADLSAQLDSRMDNLREHVESQNTYDIE